MLVDESKAGDGLQKGMGESWTGTARACCSDNCWVPAMLMRRILLAYTGLAGGTTTSNIAELCLYPPYCMYAD